MRAQGHIEHNWESVTTEAFLQMDSDPRVPSLKTMLADDDFIKDLNLSKSHPNYEKNLQILKQWFKGPEGHKAHNIFKDYSISVRDERILTDDYSLVLREIMQSLTVFEDAKDADDLFNKPNSYK